MHEYDIINFNFIIMKKILLFSVAVLLGMSFLNAQNAWFNEFHYDNASTDAGEFIEVVFENAGGYDLSMVAVDLYNESSGGVYDTKTLDQFTMGTTSGNFTLFYYNYPPNGIQNGESDGMSLSYSGTVIGDQFLSYEGTLTATDGPAQGMTSTDIGVYEDSSTEIGQSLQLSGTGTGYSEFLWEWPAAETKGQLNNDQSFGTFVPDPEPTNYPTDFVATVEGFSITLTWTDASGDQLPQAYLIKASDQDNIDLPVDGTPVADDSDLSDGTATVNVAYGLETYAFSGLASAKTYYFKIFPYTNGGENIDYKTDGTPPEASGVTSDLKVIISEDFESETLGIFSQYSVVGDQTWEWGTYGGDNFAKMSGYAGSPVANEDWLISPALNLDNYQNEILTFKTAQNYDGPMLEVKVSTDYDGSSDPNTATWSDLDPVLSSGNFEFVESGELDLSVFNGNAVYVAFLYFSTDSGSKTWQMDDFLIIGEDNVGIEDLTGLSLSYYPNPVKDFLSFELEMGEYEVTIISIDGKSIYSNLHQGGINKVDMTGFGNGIYFMNIKEIASGKNATVKVSKL